jgi:hypothetical protein
MRHDSGRLSVPCAMKLGREAVLGPRWTVLLGREESDRFNDGVEADVQLLELRLDPLQALLGVDRLHALLGRGPVTS